jgi:Holliday junction resolvase
MSKFFEIVEKIRVRPAMYIGRASVSDLFHFLVGFKAALRELGVKATKEEMDFFREFQPWIQRKYHVSTSNSWAKIIMLHCSSEQEGLDLFYKLLDEFKNRNKTLNKTDKVATEV